MLSTLIWLPVLGAIAVSVLPVPIARLKLFALGISSAAVLWSLWLVGQYDFSNPLVQFVEFVPWIEFLGLNYELGVDGLSILLLVLNSFLTWIAIYSTQEEMERPRLYYALMLLVSSAVAGAFTTQNLLLFFLFYEVELIPLYLLIAIWGERQRRNYAATKFLLYTAFSGVLILAAFLGTVWFGEGTSFSYDALLSQNLPMGIQFVLLGLLLVGFGIKIPLVPLHTWLPDTYVAASTPVAILLGGVLAKLGAYGLLRFGLGLFPEAWKVFAPLSSHLGNGQCVVRSASSDRPKRHQTNGGLQLRRTYGLHLVGRGSADSPQPGGLGCTNDCPWLDFGDFVPPGGCR